MDILTSSFWYLDIKDVTVSNTEGKLSPNTHNLQRKQMILSRIQQQNHRKIKIPRKLGGWINRHATQDEEIQ